MSELFGEAWQPKARLRHLLAVTIRRFSADGAVPGTCVYFQLYSLEQQEGGGSTVEQLLYTSEKALLDLDMYWDCLQLHNLIAADNGLNVHAPFSGQLKLVVRLSPGKSAQPVDVDACGVPGLQCPWAHGKQQSLLEHSSLQALAQAQLRPQHMPVPDNACKPEAGGEQQQQDQQQQQQEQCRTELQAPQPVSVGGQAAEHLQEAPASMSPAAAAAAAEAAAVKAAAAEIAAGASDAEVAGPSTPDAIRCTAHTSSHAGDTDMMGPCSSQALVQVILTPEGQLAIRLAPTTAPAEQQLQGGGAEQSLHQLPDQSAPSSTAVWQQCRPEQQQHQSQQQQRAVEAVQQHQPDQQCPSGAPHSAEVCHMQQQQDLVQQPNHQLNMEQQEQHAQQPAEALQHEPTAPAAGPASSDPAVMEFVFCMDTLLPAAPQPKASSEQPNHLLIEMTDGIYTPPPPEAAAAGLAERTTSAGSTPYLTRQVSLKAAQAAMPAKASVAQQQALFRWMLSNNSSVLGGLGEEQGGAGGGEDADSGSRTSSASGSEALERFGEQLAGERGLRSFWTGIFFGGQGGPGSQQQQERMRSHAAASTSSQQPAAAAGPLGGGPERTYDAREFAAETRRTMALAAKLFEVRARRHRARQRVQEALDDQAAARQQQLELHAAQEAAVDAHKRAAALEQAAAVQYKQRASARQALLMRTNGIVQAAEAASAASSRLGAAQAALLGEEGLGRWQLLHAKLVGRQNRLVADLAAAYQIGPTTGSPLDASPLAAKLDATWWSNSADAGPAAAEDEEPEPGPSADVAALVGAASTFVWPDGASDTASVASGAMGNGRAGAAVSQPAGPAARLLIFGLDVAPNLARRGLEGTMGWNGQYDEEQRVAAALGYMAHVVERLSVYLDVPLRFPLRPCSSRSTICDPAPLHHEAAEQHAAKKGWHLPAAIGGLTPLLPWHLGQPPSTTTHQQPTELPLYYDAGDRTRFAYAIFLLNKDIEQLLNAHGLASSGPNQLLQNLYKLTSAAAAALPALQAQHAVVGGGLQNGSVPAGEGGSAVGRLLGPDDWHAAGHDDAGSSSLPSLLQQGWLGSFPARK